MKCVCGHGRAWHDPNGRGPCEGEGCDCPRFRLNVETDGKKDGSWELGGSIITVHRFEAEHWWGRCTTCGLSMAAHAEARHSEYLARGTDITRLHYRCPECVTATEFGKERPHVAFCDRPAVAA